MDVLDEQGSEWRLFGYDDPTIIAAGQSHVVSQLFAIQAGAVDDNLRVAVAFSSDPLRVGPPSGPSYWDFVLRMAEGRTLAISWNGNQHYSSFLMVPDPPVRIWSERRPATSEYGVWIPIEMLRSHWASTFDELADILSRAVQGCRVVVLGTPPPKREVVIRANLEQEAVFVDYARNMGVDVRDLRLTSEVDRLTMWTVLQDMLAEHAAVAGAQFFPVPDWAMDQDGFLESEYSTPDASHANPAYGARLWSSLAAELTVGSLHG